MQNSLSPLFFGVCGLNFHTRRDVAYTLVIIWALVGIGINQSSNQAVFFLTEVSALIVAVLLAGWVLVTKLRKNR